MTPQSFAEFLYKFYFEKLFSEGYGREDVKKLSKSFSKFTLEQSKLEKDFINETINIINEL
jgi:hypothetical protein